MNTCKNCKFWTRNIKRYTSDSPNLFAGKCNCSKFVCKNDEETPNDGLGHWDYESFNSDFETGEDFGCIHFTNKG